MLLKIENINKISAVFFGTPTQTDQEKKGKDSNYQPEELYDISRYPTEIKKIKEYYTLLHITVGQMEEMEEG